MGRVKNIGKGFTYIPPFPFPFPNGLFSHVREYDFLSQPNIYGLNAYAVANLIWK